MSRDRKPPPKGQGAARAKQMGLLLDLDPDGGMDAGNEEELEAELIALMGEGGGSQAKKGGKAPVAMADIERMAALCMKDLDDEEEDEGLDDDDEDLLAELNEVLEDNNTEASTPTPLSSGPTARSTPISPSGTGGLQSCLAERINMYQVAFTNAKATGETSKARRYDRGLKTLQSMLASIKKGQPIDEAEIPPPVVTGGNPANEPQPEPIKERNLPVPALMPSPPTNQKPLRDAPPDARRPKPSLLTPPQKFATAITPDTPAISPLTPYQPGEQHSESKQAVLSRQRQYKLAAIQAKQSGDSDLAKQHYLIAKKLDSVVEALDRGGPVDLTSLPPPPAPAAPVANAPLPAPGSLAEALQQRMDKYKAAAEGAKSKGDDRKARMHQRIVKQYQDAIRSNKAGRPVNLADLPVPPGCPPLQGSESSQQNFVGVLETAMKLANQDADAEEESEDGPGGVAKPAAQQARAPAPSTPGGTTTPPKLGAKAQQQLDFLTARRQAFVRAALRSKQMKDMAGASQHLRNAKGLDHMITAAKGGLPVDISKVPSAPVSEEDYSLARSRSCPLSPRSTEQYNQLMELLKRQHEKCLGYSQQFTHMGNVAETSRFEKLAEECMKNIDVLKKAHARGHPVPKYHTEERTFSTIKLYPDLSANDMMLYVVRGINLPPPSGVSASDLDASVKFEFSFPSAEEAQRDKTSTVKGTANPEFKEQFKLNINRTHRGFKRVVQAKGIKFEIVHKGGLFKTDKVVGNAQLKLEALENQCDLREVIEVLDGRKATGGKLEVRVKIREPLGGVQLQTTTEKWLVLDPISSPSPSERQKERAPSPRSQPRTDPSTRSSQPRTDPSTRSSQPRTDPSTRSSQPRTDPSTRSSQPRTDPSTRSSQPRTDPSTRSSQPSRSPPQYKLYSFSLLNYDKERLERKIGECRKSRRDPPSDLLQQHREVTHRMQWQKAQLERASPSLLAEYESVLQRFHQGLAESVKTFSSQGNRDAAKDALGRFKLVEQEVGGTYSHTSTVIKSYSYFQ
ncbi:coiled-coil and C2 domain-containing protein 1A [Aplochiton taeniatus]